jgi:hypothetical protein
MAAARAAPVSVDVIGSSPDVPYRLIADPDEARRAVAELAERGVPVGLDLETTGLDPLTAEARRAFERQNGGGTAKRRAARARAAA